MNKSKIISVLAVLSLLSTSSFVSAESNNYIVQWKDNCVNISDNNKLYGEQLTDTLSEVNVKQKSNISKNECVEKIVSDQIVKLASNDINYKDQWYLENTGQNINGTVGQPNIDIGYRQSPKNQNTNKTRVAVIDTGVSNISDLNGKLINPKNIIDGSQNANDDNGHGTFISSLIASQSDNGIGIAGVNDRVDIVPIKVLSSNGSGQLTDLIKGIQYAIDQNVNIINLSLTTNYTDVLNSVIQDANSRGIVVIVATGNESKNLSSIKVSPANNDGNNNWVIGVGSHNSIGSRSDFSNYGTGQDTLAPGESILGTNNNSQLEYRSGTSMSAGLVTGILSYWRDYYGLLTPKEAANLISIYNDSGRIKMSNAVAKRNYPNGMLIRTNNTGVFLIKNNFKMPIVSPEVFLSHNFKWENIVIIGEDVFNQIPSGPELKLRDGTLISDANSVYVIENGLKRPIASPQVFLGMGYQWSNIWRIPDDIINSYTTGDLLGSTDRVLNGSLAYADGTGAFLIENGKKRPISSPYIFLTQYNWKDLVKVDRYKIDALEYGADIDIREGTILADQNTVYYVENGKKRPFGSPQSYLGLGLGWNRVEYPSLDIVNYIPKGDIIN